MRYLGNKESMLLEIDKIVNEAAIKDDSVFFDAFSGTGSVGDFFKNKFKIVANDYLYSAFVFTQGRLNSSYCKFKNLEFNPFEYFNNLGDCELEGFVTENYSPFGKNERMYFSIKNSKKIDFIRSKINDWKKSQLINDDEYYYLIGSLLESVSKVANIAGVYGAYLKKWDPRALKEMQYIPIESNEHQKYHNEVYNRKIEDIIEKIDCDVLYLDPPYTKNQYSVQYHVLETIAKYDNPLLKGITGARNVGDNTSDWSRPGKAEILFDKIIAKTKAKSVLISYSSAGIMSKEYIGSVLKRYGIEETIIFKKIPYKKYRNSRTESEDNHFEYLFYVKLKKKEDVVYNSPLNYMGGKSKMISFLKDNEPKNYTKFIDLFGGGFNVGINSKCANVTYNDINFKVRQLIEMFKDVDTYELYQFILTSIKKFGLIKNDKQPYVSARSVYNHPEPPLRDPRLLYVLILFGFQQQIRFNSSLEFNNPVGESGFNEKIFEKLISFSREIKEKNIIFCSNDFSYFEEQVDSDTFVYCDPPYLITLGSYNDGKRGFNGWGEVDEIRLLDFLSNINQSGGKFMLSNVLTHKGKTNHILETWIKQNNFKVIEYDKNSKSRDEIIVINY